MARNELLWAVIDAAASVLAAREINMLTSEEWEALERAVAACTHPPSSHRNETFAIEGDIMIRKVVPRRGQPYEHTCAKRVFDDVAYEIERLGVATFTGEDLHASLDAPQTQVFTALAFLKERGCIVPSNDRRHRAASDFVYEDALCEWHALRDGAPSSG